MEQLERDEHGLHRAVLRLLPSDGSDLVLVIDQFEEVFTLVEDEATRTHLLESLETAATDPRSRIRVVVTLRADFYDRPLLYRGFAELFKSRVEAVIPLSAEELERAISGPAERVDVALEPGLVAAMLADVAQEPGALPLMEYALTELFERRDGRILFLEAYRQIGGVSGALGRRAEELYAELDADGEEAARQLFLRLVALGRGPRTRGDASRARRSPRSTSISRRWRRSSTRSAPRGSSRSTGTGAPESRRSSSRTRPCSRPGRGCTGGSTRLGRTSARSGGSPAPRASGSRPTATPRSCSAARGSSRPRRGRPPPASPSPRRSVSTWTRRGRTRTPASPTNATWSAGRSADSAPSSACSPSHPRRRRPDGIRDDPAGRAQKERRVAIARELAAASVANLDVDAERSVLLALEAIETTRAVDGDVLPMRRTRSIGP